MGMTAPLVSICIPTYGGSRTLTETLDSIVAQAFNGLEVVICDDASQDETVGLADEYARRFSFIRVVRNDQNLGMDRNFVRTVQHATGTYVWLSGQDDIFRPGAFDKLRAIVGSYPAVDVVYFNYRRMNGDLTKEMDVPRLNLREDVYVTPATNYFHIVDHVPTFLAAIVMRRALWESTPYEKFLGTHYVQTGVVLHNLSASCVYIVADSRYVDCRIPEDSWKWNGGQMLFEIFSGSLEVYHIVFHSDRNPIPTELFRRKVREFLGLLPRHVVILGGLGFRRTPLIDTRMKRLFGQRPVLYWGYVWPLLHLPKWFTVLAQHMHQSSLVGWIPRFVAKALRWLGSRGYS
jgi:glycosyltransferase involved in cell wall biosynthesis